MANIEDQTTFFQAVSFNGISVTQGDSLSGITFSGYSTNGGAPLRLLTDASTHAQLVSFVKTLAEDILKQK